MGQKSKVYYPDFSWLYFNTLGVDGNGGYGGGIGRGGSKQGRAGEKL